MAVPCPSCGQVHPDATRVCSAYGCSVTASDVRGHEVVVGSPFVGRRRELELLSARLEDAVRGKGGLAILAGEAGAGKTRLAHEFAAVARARGATVLWGCSFEGDWAPPYGPWVEALGTYARTTPGARLQQDLGAGAAPLAQLVPEIRAALPDTPRAATLPPDDERVRLYDAAAQVLLALAQRQPVVLVLDDLHWADRDSLRLLRHSARVVGQAHVLILGVYRDTALALDPRHPLAEVLAVLQRETDYAHIPLRGLTPAEMALYLAQAARHELPQALVGAIYAETAGNPFYTREVLRHLLEDGKLVRRDERWAIDFSIADLGIPDGVRRVVTHRLSRLAAPTSTVLHAAAACTGGVAFPVLQAVTELAENVLLDSIDEALRAGLIRVVAGTGPVVAYDFAHAIVRHVLYEDLHPDRRARLHRRIATALEQVYGDHAGEHAAELAAQYHASAALPDARRGLPYCLSAAQQAQASYAHERAVTFLRMARDLAGAEAPAARASIWSALALAEAAALLLDAAQRSIEETLAALPQAGAAAGERAGFLGEVARVLKEGGAAHTVWEPLVERGLALVGDRRDLAWARLMLLRDPLEPLVSGPITAGRWLGADPRAVAIARASGDEEDYARTLQPFDWRTRKETAAVDRLARTWQRPVAIMRALDVAARDCIYHHGAITEAVERLQELLALSERHGSIPAQAEALAQLALCKAILGELPLAQDTLHRAQETVARLGAVHRLQVVVATAVPSVLAYFLDGDWPALARAADAFVTFPLTSRGPLGLTAASFATYSHYRAADKAETHRLLAAITPLFARLGPRSYLYNGALDRTAATIWELGASAYAPHYRRLALDLLARDEAGSPLRSNALTVARMAALCGDLAEAETYFARARAALDEAGQWPLRAIVEYDAALALLRCGSADQSAIAGLMDAALARFAALGMEDWISRARAVQEQLAAGRRTPARPAYPGGLTAREVEVLRLLAAGQTNKEIASALVVSVPTVQRHIANIYGKIDARGRADATAYALGHGLAPSRVARAP